MSELIESNQLPIRVLKFGGSSVGDPEAIRQVLNVVQHAATKNRVIVVVSALAQVTNTLDAMVNNREADRTTELLNLYRRHVETANALLSEPAANDYRAVLSNRLSSIIPSLRRVNQNIHTHFDSENILAAGERFSVPLIAAVLRDAGLQSRVSDAVSLIRVDKLRGPKVDHEKTYQQIRNWYQTLQAGEIPVVTGFIAGAPCGRTVTLGRGGSDFSASLLASALEADLLERWTDVDGLYSEDPNTSSDARKYDVLRMEDAHSLNSAKLLGMHEHTIQPLLASRTPLRVRSLRTGGSGTLVLPSSRATQPRVHSR